MATVRLSGTEPTATTGSVELGMIEALKTDELVQKAGGRFKLCTLIQRRMVQLMEGARPLVERNGRTDLEVAIEEILQDKITIEYDATATNLPRL
jgi:DNA-directed RNA polymerase subunit omega